MKVFQGVIRPLSNRLICCEYTDPPVFFRLNFVLARSVLVVAVDSVAAAAVPQVRRLAPRRLDRSQLLVLLPLLQRHNRQVVVVVCSQELDLPLPRVWPLVLDLPLLTVPWVPWREPCPVEVETPPPQWSSTTSRCSSSSKSRAHVLRTSKCSSSVSKSTREINRLARSCTITSRLASVETTACRSIKTP